MSKVIENIINDKYENYILPFFWQHGEDEATLREYMQAINEANIGAVCVESRPHPDFCGDKWWQDMDVILDEAKKRGMKVWILDDSHFPTGFANGAMENQPLSKARKSICCAKYQVKAGETFELSSEEMKHPTERVATDNEKLIAQMTHSKLDFKEQSQFDDDELVGISAVLEDGSSIDLSSQLNEDGSLSFVPAADGVVYKMNATRNRGAHPNYINMIDEASVRVLVDEVYEKHYEHYKDLFGSVIEGFFSDEPELGNGHLYDLHGEVGIGFDMDYPWSQELWDNLKAELGDDFSAVLPLVWETEGDEKKRASAKLTYMNAMTKLVEKNFSYQLGDWCRAHGVKYIGHLIEDNGQHCRTGSTLGHYFRGLKGQDFSGIDDIGGQVYPQGENDSFDRGPFQVRNGEFYHFLLGKLANSLAALDDKKAGNSMCEIFGAYGWEEGLRLEKYLADHFMVRGINHFVPHAFSAKAFPDPDCPPHFYAHGHNPEYKAFGELMTYMNRSCELISGGRHVSPVAVMYHGEAEWTGKCLADELVTRALVENQIECDIVPQDVFIEKDEWHTAISNGTFTVNTQSYKAVLIPYAQFISESFAAGIKELLNAGVKVYFVGGKPEAILGDGVTLEDLDAAENIERDMVAKAVSDFADIVIDKADSYIRYYHYVKDDTDIYMLVNEGTDAYTGSLTITGKYSEIAGKKLYIYDAWNNCIYDAKFNDGKGNITLIPGTSKFIIIPKDAADEKLLASAVVSEVSVPENATSVDVNGSWTRSIVKSIDYPKFAESTKVSLPDDYAKVDAEFSGWLKYENTFTAPEGGKYYLEVTDAVEVLTLYINDSKVGTGIYPPFVFDISDYIVAGENNIRIEIATTLEREMLKVPDMFGRPKSEPKLGSGITGNVNIYKG